MGRKSGPELLPGTLDLRQMKRRELESQGLDRAAADDLAHRFRTALA